MDDGVCAQAQPVHRDGRDCEEVRPRVSVSSVHRGHGAVDGVLESRAHEHDRGLAGRAHIRVLESLESA